MEIMDTAGGDSAAWTRYLRDKKNNWDPPNGFDGIYILFSVVDESSLSDAEAALQHAVRYRKERRPNVAILLVGNKVDLEKERIVGTKVGFDLAQKYSAAYLETSAKTPYQIHRAFLFLYVQFRAHQLAEKKEEEQGQSSNCVLA
jgi:GTPase SAR1 family protein